MEIYKFLIQSILSPFVFAIYMFALANGSLGNKSSSILGIKAFKYISTNVYAINLRLFIPFSLVTYALLFFLNYAFIRIFNNNLTLELFQKKRLTWWSLVPCSVGGLNLYGWISGMEGNVAGLLFLPLLIVILIQFFQFARQNWKLINANTTY